MPCTALKIVEGETVRRLKFLTVPEPDRLVVDIYLCDEDFIPTERLSGGMFMDPPVIEEEYHKNLRKESAEKGQFISEESTNPEWNPVL